MANTLDFHFEQLVTESDMDALQANLQQADRRLMADQVYVGIVRGFQVVEHDPIPDLTVDIQGPGIAYDQQGRRVFMPTTTTLDVSTDSNAASTAVVGVGNEKWISVYVRFTRVESDLRFDGNGVPVFFRQDESFEFIVEQGAEAAAGTATRPALRSDSLLVADILLTHGDTQIFTAAIESADVVSMPSSRFEWVFNLTASAPTSVRVGPLPDAMQAVLTALNNHVTGAGDAHEADAIGFDGSGIPAGWSDLAAATDMQAAIAAIPADLAASDGAALVGFDGAALGFAATDLQAALAELDARAYDDVVKATLAVAGNSTESIEHTLPADCTWSLELTAVMSEGAAGSRSALRVIKAHGRRASGTTTVGGEVFNEYDQDFADPMENELAVTVTASAAGVRVDFVATDTLVTIGVRAISKLSLLA